MPKRKPQVGDLAHHFAGLDARFVMAVLGREVIIAIGEQRVRVPAKNYRFTAPVKER